MFWKAKQIYDAEMIKFLRDPQQKKKHVWHKKTHIPDSLASLAICIAGKSA